MKRTLRNFFLVTFCALGVTTMQGQDLASFAKSMNSYYNAQMTRQMLSAILNSGVAAPSGSWSYGSNPNMPEFNQTAQNLLNTLLSKQADRAIATLFVVDVCDKANGKASSFPNL